MKQFVLDNSIELIICWELSRFGRNSLHTLNEIDFFSKKNIDIYFKKENIYTLSTDPMSKLVLNLLASLAEMERNTIVSRSKRGMASSALKGKRMGFSLMPYGFDADANGYIIINKEEAKYAKMMYEMASKGISLRQIIAKLNSLNVPTKKTSLGRKKTLRSGEVVGISWRTNTVRKILTSTLYKGERNFSGGHIIPIPQIVTEELWDKVQSIFSTHIGYVNNTKYDYLFKGKMYCGNCGYIISTRTEKRYHYLPSYYFCSARREPGVLCKSGQFDSKVFDELIYSQLFKNTSLLEKVYEEASKEFNLEEKQAQIAFFQDEILKQEARKKRVNSLFKDDFISPSEVKQEHTAIRNHTIELDNNIAKIKNEIANHNEIEIGTTLMKLVDETNFSIKHDFVTKYVDKVLMYNVTSNDIDYTKLTYGEYWNNNSKKELRNPHGSDKLVYVEVFAFGNPTPLKISLTNVSKQCFISENLHYENGHLSINQ